MTSFAFPPITSSQEPRQSLLNNQPSALDHHQPHTSMVLPCCTSLFGKARTVYSRGLKTHTSGFVCLLWQRPIMTRLSETIGLGQVERNRLQNVFHYALELGPYLPTKPNFTCTSCTWKCQEERKRAVSFSIHHIITAVKQNQFYFSHAVSKQLIHQETKAGYWFVQKSLSQGDSCHMATSQLFTWTQLFCLLTSMQLQIPKMTQLMWVWDSELWLKGQHTHTWWVYKLKPPRS